MSSDSRKHVPELPASDIYELLYEEWGTRHWWPAETPFEVVIGAILTQNTAWRNVERAIDALRSSKLLQMKTLAKLPCDELAKLIVPAGYYKLKARRILNFTDMLQRDFGGSLDKLFRLNTGELRTVLLSVNGIGPETADSILLYAAGRTVFVVDAYTRRFLFRHDWIGGDEGYDEIAALFTDSLAADVQVYNEFHALIVELCKRHCRRKADCGECPLRVYPTKEDVCDGQG